MSLEIPRGLPSLVCPTIATPAEGIKKAEKPLNLPPFPEIDLNGEGFTFPHFHWVTIKTPKRERRWFEEWRVLLTTEHELRHGELALTSYSLNKKYEMLILYELIGATMNKGEQIPVPIPCPINLNETRNTLEKQWGFVVHLHRESSVVEEIYAIRSSLLNSLEKSFIKEKLAQQIIIHYKEVYGESMPSFPEMYDAFDFVARKIGRPAAQALIHNVLEAGKPLAAFEGIIYEMCRIDPHAPDGFEWNLSDVQPESIANLSYEQAYHGFSRLTDHLDPDDSQYKRKPVLEYAEFSKQYWNNKALDTDDFSKFLLGSPTTLLLSKHSSIIIPSVHPFVKVEFIKTKYSQEVEYGHDAIIVEAIRQQLTQGKGLLCPFWEGAYNNCCDDSNREILEKVWSCTFPTPSCELWERLGCLKKKAVAPKTRAPKNIKD